MRLASSVSFCDAADWARDWFTESVRQDVVTDANAIFVVFAPGGLRASSARLALLSCRLPLVLVQPELGNMAGILL